MSEVTIVRVVLLFARAAGVKCLSGGSGLSVMDAAPPADHLPRAPAERSLDLVHSHFHLLVFLNILLLMALSPDLGHGSRFLGIRDTHNNSSTSLPPPFICSTCIPSYLGFHHSHHFLDLTLFENNTCKLMNPRSVYTNTQTLLIYYLDTHHPPTHQCLPAHPSSHLSPLLAPHSSSTGPP